LLATITLVLAPLFIETSDEDAGAEGARDRGIVVEQQAGAPSP
jgi:hypothetical protein